MQPWRKSAALSMWSFSQGKRVAGLVTIDVEPDNVWANTHSRTFTNIAHLPKFHALCLRFDIRPTYLVSWSIANDKASATILEALLKQGKCEIGVHPHLWETPPFVDQDSSSTAWVGPQYENDVIEAKIHTVTSLIKRRFGDAKSHRAGRWGLDVRQIPLLSSLGIVVDSSVIPGINWSSTGITDYSVAPQYPYYMASDNLVRPGNTALLQVPCTIRGGMEIFGIERHRFVAKILTRSGFGTNWLRVTPTTTVERLISICTWAVDRLPHLNLMSHSSEFMASGSPYWLRENDISAQFSTYESIFSWWRNNQVESMTLSDFALNWKSNDHNAKAV